MPPLSAPPRPLTCIQHDLRAAVPPRNGESERHYRVRSLVKAGITPRVRAVVQFRVAQEAEARGLGVLAGWIQGRVQRTSGADLHPAASIGPGLLLVHSTGVVIGQAVVAGSNLRCHHNVTLGNRDARGGDEGDHNPVLGDDVVLSAGAVVLGDVRIGDRACVGANSVVLHDVPEDDVVAGTPARSLKARCAHSAGRARSA